MTVTMPPITVGPDLTDGSDTTLARRILLIGLDGATFTILDPLLRSGVMPFLAQAVSRGVRARLQSVIPALTPPAWTSLMTGKRPGEHGVFDFFQKDAPNSHYLRFASSSDIGSETIWSLASRSGKRVISLNFPLMFPAPAVNGYVVPGGWMPWRQLRLGCYPPGLFDRLKALPEFNAREMALDMAFEEKAIEGCAPEEYADWVALHMRRERRWFDILAHLMRDDPADLTAVLFDGVDKLQHLCWRFLDPACRAADPSPWEREIANLCEAYFRQLDELIAAAVELAGPDTALVIASDHGFGPTSDVFYVNAWLEQQGYLHWAADAAAGDPAQTAPRLGLGQIARHMYLLDWERTKAYAATPSSNGIHIVSVRPDGSVGVAPHEYDELRREISAGLLSLRHPATGRRIVAEVITREQAFSGPFEPLAPDLTLVLDDGGLVSILRSEDAVQPRPEVAGTHRADGVFIAAGAGIRQGARLAPMSIIDVAPLILDCLGVPVPEDVTGQTPTSAFVPEAVSALRHRASRTATVTSGSEGAWTSTAPGATPSSAETPAQDSVFDAEAEETMLKRLQALGYVE
jgi:predicted AlkP superfamily phosphohydrolase/phosphomutase